jgi:hypothetical protein
VPPSVSRARKRSSKSWGFLAAHDDIVSGKTDYNRVVDGCVLCPWKFFAYFLDQQIDDGTLELIHLTDKRQLQLRLSAPRKAD